MPIKSSFEEVLDEAYRKCVSASERANTIEQRDDLLREEGINNEMMVEYAAKLVQAKQLMFPGMTPLPSNPDMLVEVIAEMIALVSQGFEWGWRARGLYDR